MNYVEFELTTHDMKTAQYRAVSPDNRDNGDIVIETHGLDALGAPAWTRLEPDDLGPEMWEILLVEALRESLRVNEEVQA